jgi:hypothetical protein
MKVLQLASAGGWIIISGDRERLCRRPEKEVKFISFFSERMDVSLPQPGTSRRKSRDARTGLAQASAEKLKWGGSLLSAPTRPIS